MKQKKGYFFEMRRCIFKVDVSAPPKFSIPSLIKYKLVPPAQALYLALVLIEDDFIRAGKKPEVFYGDESLEEKDFFWATAKELSALVRATPNTIRKCRRELEQAELIQSWKYWRPLLTPKGKANGVEQTTAYRLLIKKRNNNEK